MESPTFAPLEPDADAAIANLLTAAMPGVSPEGAVGFVATLRADPAASLYAAFSDDQPLALYVLRKVGVTSELLLVVVAPGAAPALDLDAQAVRDAGERVGRRPLTVETTEQFTDWYKSLGFKLVSKRRKPDGSFSFRMGWHAKKSHKSGQ
ncbi:MAG: hypothetical protein IT337_01475 [Thermomicrobiales bacterium]|nr:hypothetical protein [Thermomicrobiales bacterium]